MTVRSSKALTSLIEPETKILFRRRIADTQSFPHGRYFPSYAAGKANPAQLNAWNLKVSSSSAPVKGLFSCVMDWVSKW